MSFGECTITLQDVGMLVGLLVDGEALLSRGSANILELGVVPPQSEIKGHRVKLSWLATNFNEIADDINELHQLLPYARAWILRFIGGLLFPDRSSSYVSLRWLAFLGDFQTIKTYAWGAAVLGCLYRNLCTSTDYKTPSCGEFTLLLQLWAWERFPTILSSPFPHIPPGSPIGLRWSNTATKISMSDDIKFYRKFFDRLTRKSPDRVMRQFGCQQPIPNPPMTPAHVHALTLRGKTDDDWTTILSPALEHWANQYAYHFAPTPPQVGLLGPNSEYMRWYRRKGKLYIDPDGVKDSIVGDVTECLAYLTSPHDRPDFSVESVTEQSNRLLSISDDYRARFVEPAEEAPVPFGSYDVGTFNVPPQSREAAWLSRRRTTIKAMDHIYPTLPDRAAWLYYIPS
ncbi:serine/threonine-protein phosphatase 7 long form homolog [Cajanus cajan]|uniref:serine/threonine-protein phosphatase 7 long form homolog n=1 Tax=Cajanus cajan TaxID=3821 RepID=UPI00098D7B7A|nr:serine/threonine-protein phosphatase 7 long form homolog [Cajanus cajan]